MLLEAGPFSARLDRKTLYQDVSITLRENDFALLRGPSGSGKTTLLRQVVGLHPAPRAQRKLLGRPFSPEELPAFRRQCLYLSPNAPMLPGSIEENLRFPFGHKLAQAEFDPSLARRLCQSLGLGHLRWEQDVKRLSLGERHRLALVRALVWRPAVILADEPFTGLDQANLQAAWHALLSFSQEANRAVLCVSHAEQGPGVTRLLALENQSLVVKEA